MKRFLLLGFLVSFFCGCDCFCSDNIINPAFIGFSKSQMDTVILKRYRPNENFADLIDSVVMTDPSLDSNCCHPFRYAVQGDTTLIITRYDTIAPIRAGYDWQIYIPATRQTISITDIENGNQINCKFCSPNIISFVQNSTVIRSPVLIGDLTPEGGYRLYIRP